MQDASLFQSPGGKRGDFGEQWALGKVDRLFYSALLVKADINLGVWGVCVNGLGGLAFVVVNEQQIFLSVQTLRYS